MPNIPPQIKVFHKNDYKIYDSNWIIENNYFIHPEFGICQITGATFKSFRVAEELVELRHTGFEDSKKNPIYHGDILRYTNPKKPNRIQPLHLVTWEKKKGAFILKTSKGANGFDNSFHEHPERWLVIANVYTHPKLLTFKI